MGAVLPSSAAGKAKAVTEVAKAVDKASDAANAAKKVEQVAKNNAKGAAFEKQIYQENPKNLVTQAQQVTIKTDSNIKTRVDIIGKNKNGDIVCIECKSSQTAQLTKNQKKAFPEIEKSGGTIVGKGKPGFEGGTKIPPTKVEVVRPKD